MSNDQPPMPTPEPMPEPPIHHRPDNPEPQPRDKAHYGIQLLIGFVSFFMLSIGLGFLAYGTNLIQGGFSKGALTMLCSLALAGLGVFTLVRRSKRGPGLVAGFLIGLGLVALLAGLCLAALSNLGK
jgi:hypothetical protein